MFDPSHNAVMCRSSHENEIQRSFGELSEQQWVGRAWDLNPRLMLSPAIPWPLRDPPFSQVFGLKKLQKEPALSCWVTGPGSLSFAISWSFSEGLDRGR